MYFVSAIVLSCDYQKLHATVDILQVENGDQMDWCTNTLKKTVTLHIGMLIVMIQSVKGVRLVLAD